MKKYLMRSKYCNGRVNAKCSDIRRKAGREKYFYTKSVSGIGLVAGPSQATDVVSTCGSISLLYLMEVVEVVVVVEEVGTNLQSSAIH